MAGFGPNLWQSRLNAERSKWSGLTGQARPYRNGIKSFGECSDSMTQLKNSLQIGIQMWIDGKKRAYPAEPDREAEAGPEQKESVEQPKAERRRKGVISREKEDSGSAVPAADKKVVFGSAVPAADRKEASEGAIPGVHPAQDGNRNMEGRILNGLSIHPANELQQAMIWSEILGDPVSAKRRKKRMERSYGNQSHARRG